MLKQSANLISENCISWLNMYASFAPNVVQQRRKYMRGIKCFLRTVIGLFVKPSIKQEDDVYIFEGLRYKEYMKFFNPKSVVVVGMAEEKKYAYDYGYGFSWSFPIVAAVYFNMGWGWSYPTIKQLMFWKKELLKSSRATFFLYEDTQQLGSFFVFLARLFGTQVKSVCIQHGYFCQYEFDRMRYDGCLCDVNFVLEKSQAKLMGINTPFYEIGLPYIATAKQSNHIDVILIGTGMVADGTSIYNDSIDVFTDIYNKLARLGIKAYYRPHPNEFADQGTIEALKKTFSIIDNSNKQKILDGPRSIFIGTISTLLYEAGLAGHFVACLKLHSDITPVFNYDFKFHQNEISKLLQWIIKVKQRNILEKKSISNKSLDPLERFNFALRDANLMN
jgi:hypothetical protein